MTGTTPTYTFRVPIDMRGAAALILTYAQGGTPVVEKGLADVTLTENTVVTTLTQEDTLKFVPGTVEVQIRVRFPNEKSVKTKIKTTTADRILHEGVI